jgi:hypothetical protein
MRAELRRLSKQGDKDRIVDKSMDHVGRVYIVSSNNVCYKITDTKEAYIQLFTDFMKQVSQVCKPEIRASETGKPNDLGLIKVGLYDVIISHFSSIRTLIQNDMYDTINPLCRSILDAMLVYKGISLCADQKAYIDAFTSDKDMSECKSVTGHNMSATHIADLTSYIFPSAKKLWKHLSSDTHFTFTNFVNKLAYHGGTTEKDFKARRFNIIAGDSRRPFDEKSLFMCKRALSLMLLYWHLETEMTPEQIKQAKNEIDKRRFEEKEARKRLKT